MEFTGERFVPVKELMNDEIAFEHLHRYYAAMELAKGKAVLDIACGEGYGTAILSEKAKKVFGVDIDTVSIDHAVRTYKKGNIEFIQGSAENIPLPENSVDIVVSYETIEHIDEEAQKKFLNEVKTPIGLPIQSQTPEEIAISIAAEIISVKNSHNLHSDGF